MTKELFVSSTPHETRVGMVEDDQLAEIYLERENEYTLAGSIYKGRVTRVLPGMQSAFVDIGLERDAFLYVSDFMELHEEDEVEEIPAKGVPAQASQPQPEVQPVGDATVPSSSPQTSTNEHIEASRQPENRDRSNGGEQREARGDWRSRRRRGRGRRGERMPESRFAQPESTPSERTEYNPPPGYQPILLPGESISKYQRQAQTPSIQRLEERTTAEVPAPISGAFPEDEPLFTKTPSGDHQPSDLVGPAELESSALSNREMEQTNMAPGSGEAETETAETSREKAVANAASASGTLEEEEIEEEEADLASYVEELEEDAAFDEMEEETQHAADYQPPRREIAASAELAVPFSPEPVSPHGAEIAEAEEEVDQEAEEEAELEEAQAEAEALLDAEARGNGMVEARAEVRAPSATAPYTQRAQRPAFDRRGGPRGRRGGRRFSRHEPQHLPQITDLLKEGQEILVQIAKEPIAKKGARITSHIALPGRFLVYMPTVHHTGVSRKISSEEERQRLKRIILSERENGHGGFIVRTAAQGASEDELRADIRFLKGLWSEIKTRAEMSKAPALIYHDLNVVERVLRDQVTSDFSQIWVDNEQEYERILRFANRFQPGLVKRVKLYSKETPLFDQFGLTDEINKALKSKVWLKSGGYIVINQAEALVAIDVNTGKYVGKTARLEDTIVKTNVDAIKEIVRQIRLRDLGGIIIIDFIDMDERRNRQKVMQALEEALRSDRSPSKVLQFNDFGLVAITRKRVKQSLERTIGSPCPYCQSTGFVKSVTTVCNEVYLEMRKMAKHLEHSDVMLRVNPEVAKALKANNGRLLAEMEELTKKSVIVKSDPALHQEQFDIN
ncbi:MAG TPA: Rne/Rng family ribonuclease [Terriglobales bacterium]|nr:Rne/Rng family ribonuclease [Terriglobales bacterium]